MRTKIRTVDWTGVILDVSLIAPERRHLHDGDVTRSWSRCSFVRRAGRRLLAGPRRRSAGGDVYRHSIGRSGWRRDVRDRPTQLLAAPGDQRLGGRRHDPAGRDDRLPGAIRADPGRRAARHALARPARQRPRRDQDRRHAQPQSAGRPGPDPQGHRRPRADHRSDVHGRHRRPRRELHELQPVHHDHRQRRRRALQCRWHRVDRRRGLRRQRRQPGRRSGRQHRHARDERRRVPRPTAPRSAPV